MNRPCDSNVLRAVELAALLRELAESGYAEAEDDSCLVLYGMVRDSAFRIHHAAEAEMRRHGLDAELGRESPVPGA